MSATSIPSTSPTATSRDPLSERTRATWTAGDFGRIAQSYALGAAEFVSRLSLSVGERVLDAACGTGNTALPAARRGAIVTGVDIVPGLIEQARNNAMLSGVNAEFVEGDCEQLAYADGTFDTVITMFGAMFAPRPERVASALARVCRPGGRVIMANWAPSGFVGEMFRATSAHVPSPPGAISPLLWGDEQVVRDRFGARARSFEFTRRIMVLEFPFSPAAVVEYFRAYYGPTVRAFDIVDAERRDALRRDLEALWESNNRGVPGTTRVESEYLEVQARIA